MVWQQRRYTRRQVLKAGAAGAGLLALGPLASACGSESETAGSGGASGEPKVGGTLIIGRHDQPTVQAVGLDPHHVAVSGGNVYTLDKMYQPLYTTDAAGKLQPLMVQEHTVSSDGLVYTLTLKEGITFSDGEAVTADDVAWSLNRARTTETGSMSFLNFAIADVKAVDGGTVEITLSQPWAPLLSDLSIYSDAILPKDLRGMSEKEFFTNPIGTGPFVLKSWEEEGALITLARNENYWQSGMPYVDEVVFKLISDDNQRMLQLQSGDIQIADTVPPAQVESLKADSNVSIGVFPAWSVDLFLFNHLVDHYADRNVRRAIAQTIDTAKIVESTTFGISEAGGSFFPPSLEYYDPDTPVLKYDLEAAKADLAASGFPKGFKSEILIPSGDKVWNLAAQIIQAGAAELGIEYEIKQLDQAAYQTAFRSFEFETFINNAINDITDPDEMASFQCDNENGGSNCFWTNYDNPELAEVVRAAAAEMDSAKRAEMYSEIQATVAQDAPYVAMSYPPTIFGTTTAVSGFAVNPAGAYPLEGVSLA